MSWATSRSFRQRCFDAIDHGARPCECRTGFWCWIIKVAAMAGVRLETLGPGTASISKISQSSTTTPTEPVTSPPVHLVMIRRVLFNHTASINAALSRRLAPQRLAQRPLNQSSFVSPHHSRIASRFYSVSAEQAKQESQEQTTQAAAEGHDPAAKDASAKERSHAQEQKETDVKEEELEKKNREIIDLKVSSHFSWVCMVQC